MKRWIVGLAAAVIVLVFGVSSAPAAFNVFFGEDLGPRSTPGPNSLSAQASFLGLLTGVRTEDFEGFANGTSPPIILTFGSDTATLSGGGTFGEIRDYPDFGRFATSGTNYLNTNATFSIAFSGPQAAFGFFGTDIGDFSGQLTMTLTNGGTTNFTIPHTVGAPDASVLYYGLIGNTAADTFTSIQFGTTTASDSFGFDDMTVGTQENVIPEPPTLIIWSLLGILGIGIRWWRRRKAA